MPISMTSAAEKHVVRHLENRGHGVGIRLGVKTTGCSGLSYILEFVDEIDENDIAVISGDAKLFIDPNLLLAEVCMKRYKK